MSRYAALIWLFLSLVNAFGATFGTVVPVRGTVSDIALDEARGRLYIASFAAYQINVMNTGNQSFAAPMSVAMPPSTLALSPDSRYLVVGEDDNFGTTPATGGIAIFDLSTNQSVQIAMPDPILAVAFGSGSQALVLTTTAVLLLNPASGTTQPIIVNPAYGAYTDCLPVPFATFPPYIIQASTGVSGDGNTIMALISVAAPTTTVASSPSSGSQTTPSPTCAGTTTTTMPASSSVAVIRYGVGSSSATILPYITSPTLGPRVISVDQTGQNYLAGWGLVNPTGTLLAQFPYPTGVLNIGGHAWDWVHNRIFAQIPAATDVNAVLHVVDTDNLTVRERIQLPENLAGHSVWSNDRNTLYAVSVSGVTIFPMGGFDTAHRVAALQEDVLFQGDACNTALVSQTINVVDLGGGSVDFSLSLPANTAGIRLTPSSGITPATVQIDVDPTVFQGTKGTTAIPLTISSAGSINLGSTVRLLIATPDVNQHGRIVDVPGKITDMLADPVRNRVYLTRQDKNLILVYDTTSFQQIAAFRTGNTPAGMAITTDQNYLIVGSDNSQIDNVFDLNAMQPTTPIVLAPGLYGRSIAVASNGQIFQIARSVNAQIAAPGVVVAVGIANGLADPLPTLGVYQNMLSSPDGILAGTPGNNTILMALPDGTVVLYDATAGEWVASRKDYTSLGGAAGGFSDNLFLADNHLLNAALVPIVDLENTTGGSSGMGIAAGAGLRTTTLAANTPGMIERVNLAGFQTYNGTLTEEASVVPSILTTLPVGQIGQTIGAFVRTLAIPADQSSILLLSVSGMTVLENSFDAPSPIPAISAVSNAADGSSAVAPGGLITISGSLAPVGASATGLPLPTSLGNVCVSVSNIALPLFSVSPSQIMAQLPFSVTGASPMLVRTPGGISNAFTVNVQSFAPAIFHNGQAGGQSGLATVVRLTNNELVDFTNPIHPNETISIYLTGMAQTSPLPELGYGAPSDPLAYVSTPPTVTLGAVTLPVSFAGLVPGEVGVYQIDAYVPTGIQNADAAPLTITQGQGTTTYLVRTVNP